MNDRFEKEILYCEVCGEPLEKMIEGGPVFGMDRFHRQCLCERTKAEKEERERKLLEHAETVSRNRMICFSDRRMYDWTFANDDGTVPAMELARGYTSSFGEMMRENAGLLLWGGVGTGKTYIAASIANELIEQEYTVKMTNFATIINDLFSCGDKNEYVDALMRYSLLIIDDLGAERSTEYALENVYYVIDRRYRAGKPLIVTSNLYLDAIRNEVSIEKKRIYDRVLEMCVPVQVAGESKRAANASAKMELIKSLCLNDKIAG